MGEFEDEIAGEPAKSEPLTQQPDSIEAAPLAPPQKDSAVEYDEISAIQDQLSLDAIEALVDEPEPEAVAIAEGPVVDAQTPFDDIQPDAEDGAPALGDAETAETAEDAGEDAGEPAPEGEEPVSEGSEPAADDAELADDDLAAAIAASNEQVGTEATLDDIAPGTTHAEPTDEVAAEEPVRYGAPWWPFLIYLAAWIVLAGVAIWQFQQLATGTVFYETQQYTMLVFAGLVLAAAGVILIVAVWLGARTNPNRERVGLFSSVFVKGAAFILGGMVIWWGTLMALDYLRLGRLI